MREASTGSGCSAALCGSLHGSGLNTLVLPQHAYIKYHTYTRLTWDGPGTHFMSGTACVPENAYYTSSMCISLPCISWSKWLLQVARMAVAELSIVWPVVDAVIAQSCHKILVAALACRIWRHAHQHHVEHLCVCVSVNVWWWGGEGSIAQRTAVECQAPGVWGGSGWPGPGRLPNQPDTAPPRPHLSAHPPRAPTFSRAPPMQSRTSAPPSHTHSHTHLIIHGCPPQVQVAHNRADRGPVHLQRHSKCNAFQYSFAMPFQLQRHPNCKCDPVVSDHALA